MIGRDGPVKPFELIRWARTSAARLELGALEAHLLLVLATYCNADAICWPALRTLQADTRRGRRQVITAMRSLEEHQLVWSEQAGRGRAARRELLFNPALEPDPASSAAHRTAGTRSAIGLAVRPAAPAAVRPTALHGVNGQRNGQERQNLSAAVVVEGSINGHVTQCGSPHCSQPTTSEPRQRRQGPRPIGDVLADLGLEATP